MLSKNSTRKTKILKIYKFNIKCLLVFMMIFIFTSCSVNNKNISNTRVFIDSLGREVKVPDNIDRVAITGPLAQISLFPLVKDKLVGIATPFTELNKKIFKEKYASLPVLGQLYGGRGELNLETLLRANPQVVIDIGEPKDTAIKDFDNLEELTNIPFIHITLRLDNISESYEKLGELLDEKEKAKEIIDYCNETFKIKDEVLSKVNKKSIIYCLGKNGLNVIAENSYFSEVMDMVGENVAKFDNISSKGTGNEIDMEMLLKFNPEYIIFESETVYDDIKNNSEWKDLKAIKNNNFYIVPSIPYNVLGFPPAIQKVLGIRWLLSILYPEYIDYNYDDEQKRFNKLFFDIES